MRVVRRHLRLGAATWLVCHVLAFSALAPRDCCAMHAHGEPVVAEAGPGDHAAHSAHAAHAAPAAAGHEHHGAPPAEPDGESCPMRGPDGAPCPMHAGAAAQEGCQMTGVCNQPAAALAAVLLQAAVPAPPFALLPRGAEQLFARAADEQPLTLAVPPDSPPPRL